MSKVKISIIMPVYNEGKYIKCAIKSILNQTFKDFELIVIDDGSTDDTLRIVDEFNDKRLNIVRNKENIGITKTLNIGIKISKGDYIARMDADDISTPNRLKKQYEFLEKNKDIGAVGSQALLFKESNNQVLFKYKPVSFKEIKATFFHNNPIIHPSIMIRKSILAENNLLYDENLKASQDYDMWISLSKYTKIVNLPEVLMFYRVRNNSITQKSKEFVKDRHIYIFNKLFDHLNLNLTSEEVELYCKSVIAQEKNISFKKLNSILNKIVINNFKVNYTVDNLLKQKLGYIWLKQLNKSKKKHKIIFNKWTLFGVVYIFKNILNNLSLRLKSQNSYRQLKNIINT